MVPVAVGGTGRTAALEDNPKLDVIMVESHSPEHFRLFVAITVDDVVKAEIQRTQDGLRAGLSDGAVRWTKPEQFHLTLRFLGNVEAGSIEPLTDSLATACQAFRPLLLRAAGIGFFPNARAPRVVWAGVQDSEERLVVVQRAVQEATRRFTIEKGEERFNGHITLGRVKHLSRHATTILARTADRFSETLFGEWTAQELHLMRSELSAQGAEHRLLAAIRLT